MNAWERGGGGRFALFAAWALLVGCGGRAARAEQARGGSEALGGAEAGDRTDGVGESTPRGCPDESWGSCDAGLLLTVSTTGRSDGREGAWIEPLQVVRPSPAPFGPIAPAQPPGEWDRSELPSGACVFRAHGVPVDCFGIGAEVTMGRCGGGPPGPRPIPFSYYELSSCAEGVAPGCPGPADPWSKQNYTWYAAKEPDGTATIVLCARLCEQLLDVGEGCLAHARQ